MQRECESFVGRREIPIRHGMTVGELALLFNSEFVPKDAKGKKCRLEIVPMRYVKRWRGTCLYTYLGDENVR